MPITYVKGDATKPKGPGQKVIVHSCNTLGVWGKGFVLAVSKRWSEPEAAYRSALLRGPLELGSVHFATVSDDIVVANLIGQKGIVSPVNNVPVKYSAIRRGMEVVAARAKKAGASIHMPRIGCGLGGGTWDMIEPILLETCEGLEVTVYDLK